MTPAPRLLLFDIDGTLVTTGGAGKRALDHAFRELHAWEEATAGMHFGGMTDPLIVETVLARRGLDPGGARAALADLVPVYLRHLERELREGAAACRALAGVLPLLARLAGDARCTLGLLTGNVRQGAHLKLRACGIETAFPVGAFGDEAPRRIDLLPLARARAADHDPRLSDLGPRDVIVIGDTPRDIEVAHAHGARALAVASGKTCSRDELAAHRPEGLLDDLSQVDEVVEWLLG